MFVNTNVKGALFIVTKITELIDDFKLEQQIEGKKPEYIKMCNWRLNKWAKYMQLEHNIIEVEEVTNKHIKLYILYLQRKGTQGAPTINNTLATIKVFFRYLVDEEYMDEGANPATRVATLKEPKRVITTFSDEEVAQIFASADGDTYYNIRDRLILILLFDTGLRVSELCGIKNVDIARKHIVIHGKGSKQRLIYISRTMRKYMRKYNKAKEWRYRNHEEECEYYFVDQSNQKLHRSTINKILKRHCQKANIRPEVRCSPHDCRHYFAQKQLRNGLDLYSLSRLLGHYDTQMTTKYLRGLEQETILELGSKKSPLNTLRL